MNTQILTSARRAMVDVSRNASIIVEHSNVNVTQGISCRKMDDLANVSKQVNLASLKSRLIYNGRDFFSVINLSAKFRILK